MHAPYICPASRARTVGVSFRLSTDVSSLFLSSFRACALHLSSFPCTRCRCVFSGNLRVFCPCFCPASSTFRILSLFILSFQRKCNLRLCVFLLSAHAPLCSVLIFSYSVLLNTCQEPVFLLIKVRKFSGTPVQLYFVILLYVIKKLVFAEVFFFIDIFHTSINSRGILPAVFGRYLIMHPCQNHVLLHFE